MAASERLVSATLTWNEFLRCANEFRSISDCLNDGWIIRSLKDIEEPNSFYLEKKTITPIETDCEIKNSHGENINIDRSTLNVSPKRLLTREYHIVYSIAYSTPVMYFTAWTQDGHVLPLEEIWEKMMTSYQPLSTQLKWSTITQQIHPVLQRPFYQLHPCRTADLMKVALSSFNGSYNYLICWLSSVTSIIGLTLNIKYAKMYDNLIRK